MQQLIQENVRKQKELITTKRLIANLDPVDDIDMISDLTINQNVLTSEIADDMKEYSYLKRKLSYMSTLYTNIYTTSNTSQVTGFTMQSSYDIIDWLKNKLITLAPQINNDSLKTKPAFLDSCVGLKDSYLFSQERFELDSISIISKLETMGQKTEDLLWQIVAGNYDSDAAALRSVINTMHSDFEQLIDKDSSGDTFMDQKAAEVNVLKSDAWDDLVAERANYKTIIDDTSSTTEEAAEAQYKVFVAETIYSYTTRVAEYINNILATATRFSATIDEMITKARDFEQIVNGNSTESFESMIYDAQNSSADLSQMIISSGSAMNYYNNCLVETKNTLASLITTYISYVGTASELYQAEARAAQFMELDENYLSMEDPKTVEDPYFTLSEDENVEVLINGKGIDIKPLDEIRAEDYGTEGGEDFYNSYILWAGGLAYNMDNSSIPDGWYNGYALSNAAVRIQDQKIIEAQDKWMNQRKLTKQVNEQITSFQQELQKIEYSLKVVTRKLPNVADQLKAVYEKAHMSQTQSLLEPNNSILAKQSQLDFQELNSVISDKLYLEKQKVDLKNTMTEINAILGYRGDLNAMLPGMGATGLWKNYYYSVNMENYYKHKWSGGDTMWQAQPLAATEESHGLEEGRHVEYIVDSRNLLIGQVVTRQEAFLDEVEGSGELKRLNWNPYQIALQNNGTEIPKFKTYRTDEPLDEIEVEETMYTQMFYEGYGVTVNDASSYGSDDDRVDYGRGSYSWNNDDVAGDFSIAIDDSLAYEVFINDGDNLLGSVYLAGQNIASHTLPDGFTPVLTSDGLKVERNLEFDVMVGRIEVPVLLDGTGSYIGKAVLIDGAIRADLSTLPQGYSINAVDFCNGMLEIVPPTGTSWDQKVQSATVQIYDQGMTIPGDENAERFDNYIGYVELTYDAGAVFGTNYTIASYLKEGYSANIDNLMSSSFSTPVLPPNITVERTGEINIGDVEYNVEISDRVDVKDAQGNLVQDSDGNQKQENRVFGYVTIRNDTKINTVVPAGYSGVYIVGNTLHYTIDAETGSSPIDPETGTNTFETGPSYSAKSKQQEQVDESSWIYAVASKQTNAWKFDVFGGQDFAMAENEYEKLYKDITNRSHIVYNDVHQIGSLIVNELDSRIEAYVYGSEQSIMQQNVTDGILDAIGNFSPETAFGISSNDVDAVTALMDRVNVYNELAIEISTYVQGFRSFEYNAAMINMVSQLTHKADQTQAFALNIANTSTSNMNGVNVGNVDIMPINSLLIDLTNEIEFTQELFEKQKAITADAREKYENYYYNREANISQYELLIQALQNESSQLKGDLNNRLIQWLKSLVGEDIVEHAVNLDNPNALEEAKQMIADYQLQMLLGGVSVSDDIFPGKYQQQVYLLQKYKDDSTDKQQMLIELEDKLKDISYMGAVTGADPTSGQIIFEALSTVTEPTGEGDLVTEYKTNLRLEISADADALVLYDSIIEGMDLAFVQEIDVLKDNFMDKFDEFIRLAQKRVDNMAIALKTVSIFAAEKQNALEELKEEIYYIIDEINSTIANIKAVDQQLVDVNLALQNLMIIDSVESTEIAQLKFKLLTEMDKLSDIRSSWLGSITQLGSELNSGDVSGNSDAILIFAQQLINKTLGNGLERMISLSDEVDMIMNMIFESDELEHDGTIEDPYKVFMDHTVFEQLVGRLRVIKDEADLLYKTGSCYGNAFNADVMQVKIQYMYSIMLEYWNMLYERIPVSNEVAAVLEISIDDGAYLENNNIYVNGVLYNYKLKVKPTPVLEDDIEVTPGLVFEAKDIIGELAYGILTSKVIVPEDVSEAGYEAASLLMPRENILTRETDSSAAINDIIQRFGSEQMKKYGNDLYDAKIQSLELDEIFDSAVTIADMHVNDPDAFVSTKVTTFLGEFDFQKGVTDNAIAKIDEILKWIRNLENEDLDEAQREAAAQELGLLGDERAIAVLTVAVDDDSTLVSDAATAALLAIRYDGDVDENENINGKIIASIIDNKTQKTIVSKDEFEEIKDLLDLKVFDPGALQKTVVFRHNMPIQEIIFTGEKGSERVLIRKQYYTGSDDVKEIVVFDYNYEMNQYVLEIETAYYGDTYLIKSKKHYGTEKVMIVSEIPDDAVVEDIEEGIVQYSGREKPTYMAEYAMDDQEKPLTETVYFYDTQTTMALERSLRFENDWLAETRYLTISEFDLDTGRVVQETMLQNLPSEFEVSTILYAESDLVTIEANYSDAFRKTSSKYFYSAIKDGVLDPEYNLDYDLDKDDPTDDAVSPEDIEKDPEYADRNDLDYVEQIAYVKYNGQTSEQKTYMLYSGANEIEKLVSIRSLQGMDDEVKTSTSTRYYNSILDSLKNVYDYNELTEALSSVTTYTGYEGEEEIKTVKGYRVNSDGIEELDFVAKYYYSIDGRLLTKITDKYSDYGSKLYLEKPVVRKRYDFEGSKGRERISREIDENGIIHYYTYLMDPQPNSEDSRGLLTIVSTHKGGFDGETIGDVTSLDFTSQVLSRQLLREVYASPNYIPTSDATTVISDEQGLTIAVIDRYGTVNRYSYKLTDDQSQILKDDKGRIVETTITLPDGSQIIQGPDGFRVKFIDNSNYDVFGNFVPTEHIYEYGRDGRSLQDMDGNFISEIAGVDYNGDVLVDQYNKSEYTKEYWVELVEDVYAEDIGGSMLVDKYWLYHEQEYSYGELTAAKHVSEEYAVGGLWNPNYGDPDYMLDAPDHFNVDNRVYSRWIKNDAGVWELKVAESAAAIDDPSIFSLEVDPETGAILNQMETLQSDTRDNNVLDAVDINGDGFIRKQDGETEDLNGNGRLDEGEDVGLHAFSISVTPDQFGNYDFYAEQLDEGDFMVYIYKGDAGGKTIYTGLTLKYNVDGSGTIGNLTEINDRIADAISIVEYDAQDYITDPASTQLFVQFKRAPSSQRELVAIQNRESYDFELEGGIWGDIISGAVGGTRQTAPPLEVKMEQLQSAMLFMEADIEKARDIREIAWSTTISDLVGQFDKSLTIPERGNKKITYDWQFSEVYPDHYMGPDPNIDINWEKVYIRGLGLMCATSGGIMGSMAGIGVYNDTMNVNDFVTAGEILKPRWSFWNKRRDVKIIDNAFPEKTSLDSFKGWVTQLKQYSTDSFIEDVVDFVEYLKTTEIPIDASGNPATFETEQFDEDGNVITELWLNIAFSDDDISNIINNMATTDLFSVFVNWLEKTQRRGGLYLGDEVTALIGQYHYKTDNFGNIQYESGSPVYKEIYQRDLAGNIMYDGSDQPIILDEMEGVYNDDEEVTLWIKGYVEAFQTALGSSVEDYIDFIDEQETAVDDFLYDPATGDTWDFFTVNTAFTGVLQDAYGIEIDGTEAEIHNYLERARAMYQYVIQQQKTEASLRFSTKFSNIQSDSARVAGSDKPEEKMAEDVHADFLNLAKLMHENDLELFLDSIIVSETMTVDVYKELLIVSCDNADLEDIIINYFDDMNMPVWIPGTVSIAPDVEDKEKEQSERLLQLKQWLKFSKGFSDERLEKYTPGVLDWYEWEMQKIAWAFKKSQNDLSMEIRLKELAVDNVFDPNYGYDPLTAFDALDVEQRNYLYSYMTNFWAQGDWDEEYISQTGMMEMSYVETLTKELVDVMSVVIDTDYKSQVVSPNNNIQIWANPILEHLNEYKAKADIVLHALEGYMPTDNVKVWEQDSLAHGDGPNDDEILWDEWSNYINTDNMYNPGATDDDIVDLRDRYVEYGYQKENLCSYAVYQYLELAMGMIEQLENLKEKYDIEHMVTTMVSEIQQYSSDYIVKTDSSLQILSLDDMTEKQRENEPYDIPTYISSVDGKEYYKYGSLEQWKQALLQKITTYSSFIVPQGGNNFVDVSSFLDSSASVGAGTWKDAKYALAEDIREAAKLREALALDVARKENQKNINTLNALFNEFDQNVYRPAKQSVLSYVDKNQWMLYTEIVELSVLDENGIEISGSTAAEADSLELVYDQLPENVLRKKQYTLKIFYDLEKTTEEDSYGNIVEKVTKKEPPVKYEVTDGVNTYQIFADPNALTIPNELSFVVPNGDESYVCKVKMNLAISQVNAELRNKHKQETNYGGKLFDEEYKKETYGNVIEQQRDAFDLEEELLYRDYAAKVGMGGKQLGLLYRYIEDYYAGQMKLNVQSYLAGLVTWQEYETNIRDIRYQRFSYRDAVEKYMLGISSKIDITVLSSSIVPGDADRLYGILKDLTIYMTEKEKQEFIKGEELTRLTQQYDSLFELMVEQYDAIVFEEMLNQGPTADSVHLDNSHKTHITKFYEDFEDNADALWTEYQTKTVTALGAYESELTNLKNAFGTATQRYGSISDIFSWVPSGSEYDEFKRSATPGVTQGDPIFEDLGAAVFEKMTQFMIEIGGGLERKILIQNGVMNRIALFADNVRQGRIDEDFYEYSEIMAAVNQAITAYTDTGGLNYETSGQHYHESWFKMDGHKYHLDNYAYSDDEELRNAYMGYQILTSLTQTAFEGAGSDMEGTLQKMLAQTLGINIGEYQYKEFANEIMEFQGNSDTLYGLSVTGQDRYHDFKGNYNKKVFGELKDKWFLNSEVLNTNAAVPSTISTGSADTTAVKQYNNNIKNAYDDLVKQVSYSLIDIYSMELRKKSDGEMVDMISNLTNHDFGAAMFDTFSDSLTPQSTGYTVYNNSRAAGGADLDLQRLDLMVILKEDIDTFNQKVYEAQQTYSAELIKYGTYNGNKSAVKNIVRISASGKETDTSAVWEDVLDLVSGQLSFYENTIQTARDYIEYGLPGTSWSDIIEGNPNGRRNLHLYAMYQFEKYYKPDVDNFTNDNTYDALDRVGTEYLKALGMGNRDGRGNVTTQNWSFLNQQYLNAGMVYDIADITSGLIAQYASGRDGAVVEKIYGDGLAVFENDLISDLYSDEFVYQKLENGGLMTDKRGASYFDPTSANVDTSDISSKKYTDIDTQAKAMWEITEADYSMPVIRSYDDLGMQRLTRIDKYYDSDEEYWNVFAYSSHELEGYSIDFVNSDDSLSRENMGEILMSANKHLFQEQKAAALKADTKPPVMSTKLLIPSLRGSFNGIRAFFGFKGDYFSQTNINERGVFWDQKDVKITALDTSSVAGLTRRNVRSRLRSVARTTNMRTEKGVNYAYGKLGGINVTLQQDLNLDGMSSEYQQAFMEGLSASPIDAGIGGYDLIATVPGRVQVSDVGKSAMAVTLYTGAHSTMVHTKEGMSAQLISFARFVYGGIGISATKNMGFYLQTFGNWQLGPGLLNGIALGDGNMKLAVSQDQTIAALNKLDAVDIDLETGQVDSAKAHAALELLDKLLGGMAGGSMQNGQDAGYAVNKFNVSNGTENYTVYRSLNLGSGFTDSENDLDTYTSFVVETMSGGMDSLTTKYGVDTFDGSSFVIGKNDLGQIVIQLTDLSDTQITEMIGSGKLSKQQEATLGVFLSDTMLSNTFVRKISATVNGEESKSLQTDFIYTKDISKYMKTSNAAGAVLLRKAMRSVQTKVGKADIKLVGRQFSLSQDNKSKLFSVSTMFSSVEAKKLLAKGNLSADERLEIGKYLSNKNVAKDSGFIISGNEKTGKVSTQVKYTAAVIAASKEANMGWLAKRVANVQKLEQAIGKSLLGTMMGSSYAKGKFNWSMSVTRSTQQLILKNATTLVSQKILSKGAIDRLRLVAGEGVNKAISNASNTSMSFSDAGTSMTTTLLLTGDVMSLLNNGTAPKWLVTSLNFNIDLLGSASIVGTQFQGRTLMLTGSKGPDVGPKKERSSQSDAKDSKKITGSDDIMGALSKFAKGLFSPKGIFGSTGIVNAAGILGSAAILGAASILGAGAILGAAAMLSTASILGSAGILGAAFEFTKELVGSLDIMQTDSQSDKEISSSPSVMETVMNFAKELFGSSDVTDSSSLLTSAFEFITGAFGSSDTIKSDIGSSTQASDIVDSAGATVSQADSDTDISTSQEVPGSASIMETVIEFTKKLFGSAGVFGAASLFGATSILGVASGVTSIFSTGDIFGGGSILGSALEFTKELFGSSDITTSKQEVGSASAFENVIDFAKEFFGSASIFSSESIFGSAGVFGSAGIFSSAGVFGAVFEFAKGLIGSFSISSLTSTIQTNIGSVIDLFGSSDVTEN